MHKLTTGPSAVLSTMLKTTPADQLAERFARRREAIADTLPVDNDEAQQLIQLNALTGKITHLKDRRAFVVRHTASPSACLHILDLQLVEIQLQADELQVRMRCARIRRELAEDEAIEPFISREFHAEPSA